MIKTDKMGHDIINGSYVLKLSFINASVSLYQRCYELILKITNVSQCINNWNNPIFWYFKIQSTLCSFKVQRLKI